MTKIPRLTALIFLAAALSALPSATLLADSVPSGGSKGGKDSVPLGGKDSVDWPQWRGPNQDLKSSVTGVFDDAFGLEVQWMKDLGSGYSSISVVGNRAVTMFSDGEHDVLAAFAADSGEELWRYEIAPTYKGHSGSDDGPLGTPTIHDGVVYVLGPKGHLVAVTLERGEAIWSHKIDEVFDAVAPTYGFTTVPVVADGLLVVQTGGDNGRCVSAFDAKTGEMRWSNGNDPVGYHSPLFVELAGERQLLAISNQHLIGLVPATGKELWKHRYTEDEDWGAQPVVFGGDKILVAFTEDAAVYQLAKQDGQYALNEVWRDSVFRHSDTVPIYHEGHLYGFRGRFLTAVDAMTGEVQWKSRPPGQGGMVLVDEHLVTYAGRGEVIVVEANPEAYVEKARLKISERFSYTPPSFAGGRLYVRDLTEIASISITDEAVAAVETDSVPLLGEFGDFIRGLRKAQDKKARIDRFLEEQKSFPIVEGDELAHFVYRGDVEDIALAGNMWGDGDEHPMQHVAGTDLYFRSYRLTPKAHYEYNYSIFDERITDPKNPRTFGPEGAEASVLAMPGWVEAEHLREPAGERGTVETFTWKSELLENEREMTVWLPPGYGESKERYPLVVVNYGNLALSHGLWTHSLDNLVGESVAPLVAVFLPRVDFDEYAARIEEWSEALATELVPHLEKTYRLLPGAENRAMTGIASGAFGSIYAALRQGVAGNVATQSFYFRDEAAEKLREMIAGDEEQAVRFYVEWSVNDLDRPAIHSERDSVELAALLEEHGYPFTKNEVVDGAGWGSWRSRTDRILETFFPAP